MGVDADTSRHVATLVAFQKRRIVDMSTRYPGTLLIEDSPISKGLIPVPGTTATELYELYIAFGPDPFVVPLDPNDPDVKFSAWRYAKEQCKELVSLSYEKISQSKSKKENQ